MVYGYVRVSTDSQDVEAQKIGINEKAASMNMKIDRWIEDEGISGTVVFQKRKLGKLMKILKEDDVIIASEISRFARKLFLLFEFLGFITQKKVQLWTVKDAYHLDGSLQSTIMAFAFGIAAQIERDMISQRTIEGLRRRREEGIVLGRKSGCRSKTKKRDKKQKEVENYINKGLSYSAIARLTGLHRLTVVEICKDLGILRTMSDKEKNNHNRKKKIYEKELKIKLSEKHIDADMLKTQFKKSYFSFTQMSKDLNISYSSLINLLKKINIYEELIDIKEMQRLTHPSLSMQGKKLGLSDTRDVRKYLRENKEKTE